MNRKCVLTNTSKTEPDYQLPTADTSSIVVAATAAAVAVHSIKDRMQPCFPRWRRQITSSPLSIRITTKEHFYRILIVILSILSPATTFTSNSAFFISSCIHPRNQIQQSKLQKRHQRQKQQLPQISRLWWMMTTERASNETPSGKTRTRTEKESILLDSEASSSSERTGGFLRISPEELNQLQQAVNLVEVVESYDLPQFQKRSGSSRATALCPFHDDRNPSLQIDGTKGIYKCFSCGASGNVYTFVREMHKLRESEELPFLQAVRLVQEQYAPQMVLSINTIGHRESSSTSTNTMTIEERQAMLKHHQRLMLANTMAATYYEQCLMTLPEAGGARSHLQARGFVASTVRAFTMGYALDAYYGRAAITTSTSTKTTRSWGEQSLVSYLRDHGFRPSEIVQAGLAIRTNPKTKPTMQYPTMDGKSLFSPTQNSTNNNTTLGKPESTTMLGFPHMQCE